MQALIIINPHDARQLGVADRIREELGGHADIVRVEELSAEMTKLLRISATPQIVYIGEQYAGERLLATDAAGSLALSAEVLNLYDMEQTALGRPSDMVGQRVIRELELMAEEIKSAKTTT